MYIKATAQTLAEDIGIGLAAVEKALARLRKKLIVKSVTIRYKTHIYLNHQLINANIVPAMEERAAVFTKSGGEEN